jgi:phage terminase large subunit
MGFSNFSQAKLKKLRKKIWENPRWFSRKILGEDPWETQDLIMESVRDNIRTAVGACHAPGKTRTAARVVPWFLLGQRDAKIICTAPTWRQVEQLLFSEIRALIHKAPYNLGLSMPPKAPEIYLSDDWYCIGLSTNQPERFQGYHAPSILVIIDEASGVDDGIWEAVQGIMASGKLVRLLLLSNTTRGEGFFFECCTDGVEKGLVNFLPISCVDTPNFEDIREAFLAEPDVKKKIEILRSVPDEKLKRSYLVKPSWLADLIQQFGIDSAVVRIRAFAEFPGEVPDQLFPLWLVERAMHRWEALVHKHWWELEGTTLKRKPEFHGFVDFGCDISRYGDSETGIAPIANGICAPLQVWQKYPPPETAARIMTIGERLRANKYRIDADGVGGPVADILVKARVPGVIDFRGGLPANNKRRFLNQRCEGYFELLDALTREELALPPCPKLLGQLTILRYWLNEDGQLCVTTKEELREEGKASPDRADMVMMGNKRGGAVRVGSKPAGW